MKDSTGWSFHNWFSFSDLYWGSLCGYYNLVFQVLQHGKQNSEWVIVALLPFCLPTFFTCQKDLHRNLVTTTRLSFSDCLPEIFTSGLSTTLHFLLQWRQTGKTLWLLLCYHLYFPFLTRKPFLIGYFSFKVGVKQWRFHRHVLNATFPAWCVLFL